MDINNIDFDLDYFYDNIFINKLGINQTKRLICI